MVIPDMEWLHKFSICDDVHRICEIKVVGETPPEINQQSFGRLHINCLLEFWQSFAFGGFSNHQSFDKVYTNCSLEFQQSFNSH